MHFLRHIDPDWSQWRQSGLAEALTLVARLGIRLLVRLAIHLMREQLRPESRERAHPVPRCPSADASRATPQHRARPATAAAHRAAAPALKMG